MHFRIFVLISQLMYFTYIFQEWCQHRQQQCRQPQNWFPPFQGTQLTSQSHYHMCRWEDNSGCRIGYLDALSNFCINFTIKCILHIFFKNGVGIINDSADNPETCSPHSMGPSGPFNPITTNAGGGIALDAQLTIWMHFGLPWIFLFNNNLFSIFKMPQTVSSLRALRSLAKQSALLISNFQQL